MQQTVMLRPYDTPLEWHEAAAVLQLVAEHVAAGRLPGVPRLEWLSLDDRGALLVSAPSDASAKDWAGGPPFVALRGLLRQLVGSNTVPLALQSALESAGDGSAAAFSQAIRFFVRPSTDLKTVAVRLREREESGRLLSELDVLTQKTRAPEPHPAERPDRAEAQSGSDAGGFLRRHRSLVLSLGAFAFALVLLLLSAGGGAESDAPAALSAASLVQSGKALLNEVGSGARSLLGAAGKQNRPAATGSSSTTPARKSRPVRAQGKASTPPESRTATAVAVPVSWILAGGVTLPSSPLGSIGAVVETGALFDAGDGEVSPPTLVRPRIPTVPPGGARAGDFGRLEVIVSATGEVERVRLLETTSEGRYYDAMLLPAVKAWIFSPARRQGHTVRYRLEIPLTR